MHARDGVEREQHGHVAGLHAVLARGHRGAEGGLGGRVGPVDEGNVGEVGAGGTRGFEGCVAAFDVAIGMAVRLA